jgi:hypothetical protein
MKLCEKNKWKPWIQNKRLWQHELEVNKEMPAQTRDAFIDPHVIDLARNSAYKDPVEVDSKIGRFSKLRGVSHMSGAPVLLVRNLSRWDSAALAQAHCPSMLLCRKLVDSMLCSDVELSESIRSLLLTLRTNLLMGNYVCFVDFEYALRSLIQSLPESQKLMFHHQNLKEHLILSYSSSCSRLFAQESKKHQVIKNAFLRKINKILSQSSLAEISQHRPLVNSSLVHPLQEDVRRVLLRVRNNDILSIVEAMNKLDHLFHRAEELCGVSAGVVVAVQVMKNVCEREFRKEVISGRSFPKVGEKIINNIMKHPSSVPFQQPFDWKAAGLVEYGQVVEKPMDLSTIKKLIKSKDIKNVVDLKAHLMLIWNNATLFNDVFYKIFLKIERIRVSVSLIPDHFVFGLPERDLI